MMWSVVALLILNESVRSEWIWIASIFIMIIAVIAYFSPRLKKSVLKSKENPKDHAKPRQNALDLEEENLPQKVSTDSGM